MKTVTINRDEKPVGQMKALDPGWGFSMGGEGRMARALALSHGKSLFPPSVLTAANSPGNRLPGEAVFSQGCFFLKVLR